MNNEQKAANGPAYPPQFISDQFNRLLAPIPGMTLKQAVAIAVLPALIQSYGGGEISQDVEIAFSYADQFCERIDKENSASNPAQIIT